MGERRMAVRFVVRHGKHELTRLRRATRRLSSPFDLRTLLQASSSSAVLPLAVTFCAKSHFCHRISLTLASLVSRLRFVQPIPIVL